MKKIILFIAVPVMFYNSYAQSCGEVDGLKPISFLYTFNGNPGTTIQVIPGNWNRLYKLNETTGLLTAETCIFPCCPTYGACVCYVQGTYFRRVTPPCDPTPCGGDMPLPGMPKTDDNSSANSWSQASTWIANQVPDIPSSPAVVITKATQIDQDLNFINDHWLVLASGSSIIAAGKIVINNALIKVYDAASFENFGTISGNGQVLGTFTNSGILSPGNSPGKFTITGNYNATALAVHQIEIAAANLYDTISIAEDVSFASGNAVIAGTLNVSLLNGYIPVAGDVFKIFTFKLATGIFSTTNLPALPNGLMWSIEYNATDITLKVIAGTLPIQFVTVNAYQKGNGIQVEWNTTNEINLKKYEVEKSIDGIHFFKAATTDGSNNGGNNSYKWFDSSIITVNSYYRLKAIDADGKFMYSLIMLVKKTGGRGVAIYPNPVKRGESIRINLQSIVTTKVEIINMLAQVVYSNAAKLTGSISIPVSNAIPPGQYMIRIISENKVEVQKIQVTIKKGKYFITCLKKWYERNNIFCLLVWVHSSSCAK
jgi:hypothetical protein